MRDAESAHPICGDRFACVNRRALRPDFLTLIYYFKPYPGSELVIEAVARGFRLPETLEAWSEFDYVAGLPGPWASPQKFHLIERFKCCPAGG
jgi:anaerobic magnesium-protoporphyrin IX monomethyl ester cyclase